MKVNDLLNNRNDLLSLGSVNSDKILRAEQLLHLRFSSEYKSYVTEFGAVSFWGHELTGISDVPALNVVKITEELRNYTNVSNTWYVIENIHIDDIVFWQDHNGVVYRTMPNAEPTLFCKTLADYISMCK